MTSITIDAIADRAQEIRFTRILLTILATPFWVLGALAGVVWVAFTWCLAAVQVGFADGHKVKRGSD